MIVIVIESTLRRSSGRTSGGAVEDQPPSSRSLTRAATGLRSDRDKVTWPNSGLPRRIDTTDAMPS